MIVLQFHNRFIWLTLGLGALMAGQLTVLQIRCMTGQSPYGQGLSTFDLLAALMLVIESATVIVMLLSLLSEDSLRLAWEKHWPQRSFSPVAAGMSAMPVQLISALILLLPILWLHRYPELSEAQNISIPLTLLQRFLLMFLVVQLAANLLLVLRWFTKLPRWACALIAMCGYWSLGYWLTWLSYTNERFARFNDVFYFNQLWKHIPGYPELMRSMVTLDIHKDFQLAYIWLLLGASLLNILWLPRAALAGDRQGRLKERKPSADSGGKTPDSGSAEAQDV